MDSHSKKELFDIFSIDWGDRFKMIPAIIKYLTTYPEIESKIEEFFPLDLVDLNNSQLEWISLVAQLDNPIETTFFKDFWIPIQKNRYDYFIDLSADSLPLFEVDYFPFEPYRWYKKSIFKDLSLFLLDIDDPNFNIEKHFENLENERLLEVEGFFNERDELGLAGKLKPDPINKDSIFDEDENSDFKFQNDCLTFRGVTSAIVGLLPYDWQIKLEGFSAQYIRNKNVLDKVKSIESLVYLVQSVGLLSVASYSITFDSDIDCRADYNDNTFKIIHYDSVFLKSLIEKYETIKNS